MAKRRMFSMQIVDSDAFMEMPASAQLLYFHLGMRADNEGFVGNPRGIMKRAGSADNDYDFLIGKRFIIQFGSGICVIKHWLMHNTIRLDRDEKTGYTLEREQLFLKDNKSYTLNEDHADIDITKKHNNARHLPGNSQANLIKSNLIEEKSETSSHLPKIEKSKEYLTHIPLEDLESMYQRFDCSKEAIKSKAEDLLNWCESKGKYKKNYRAFLLLALKKDFPTRKAPPHQPRRVEVRDGVAYAIER